MLRCSCVVAHGRAPRPFFRGFRFLGGGYNLSKWMSECVLCEVSRGSSSAVVLEFRELWWAFRSPRPPHCPPSYDACACARSYVGGHVRDFGPRDQSVGAPPTFCTSDKCECGRLRAGSLEQFRGIPVASYGTKALPQDT